MALRRRPGTKQGPPHSKLEAWRLKRGLSQPEMVKHTGIPITTYQRLEEAEYKTLPYEKLVNCSIVLGVKLDELIEDRFKGWTVFSAKAKVPPEKPPWRSVPASSARSDTAS